MKEKIKIICLILITVAISVSAWYTQKTIIYLNAYKDYLRADNSEFNCFIVLTGGK